MSITVDLPSGPVRTEDWLWQGGTRCTTNRTFIQQFDSFWWCYGSNGNHIYCANLDVCNRTSCNADKLCACIAPFDADPDVAGIGVLVGFNATAWLTILVAWKQAYNQGLRQWPSVAPGFERPNKRLGLERVAHRLLATLCDVQIVTGMAIVATCLIQISDMSYYHQTIASCLWELTLVSFWISRPDWELTERRDWPDIARKVVVITSCTLYVAFSILSTMRWYANWDLASSGRCFRSNDTTGLESFIFWTLGTLIYSLGLILSMTIPKNIHGPFDWLYEKYKELERTLHSSCSLTSPRMQLMKGDSHFTRLCYPVVVSWLFITRLITAALLWFCLNFLAMWTYAYGYYPAEAAAYTGLAAWNTWAIIDLKRMNSDLLRGSESEWGFGQLLPLLLFVLIALSFLDAIHQRKED